MAVSIEISRNTAIVPSPNALTYDKYKVAKWFNFDKRLKESGLSNKDVPEVLRQATMAEDSTRTVSKCPYLVFWGEKLLIGWEVQDDGVTVYGLEKGVGNSHVGKLHYRDGRTQEVVVEGEGLSSQRTDWGRWNILNQIFPQLRALEMVKSERSPHQTVSLAGTIIAQNEVKVKNHIAAMKRKTIRAMEAEDED